jgi:HSP20 family protein
MADKHMTTLRSERQQPQVARQSPPFAMMHRVADEMDRLFDDLFWRPWSSVRLARRWRPSSPSSRPWEWTPAVDILQRGDELVIRADLPGLRREDVTVEVSEDAVTIQGEQQREQTENQDDVYRSERHYGSFCRVIPLPEGTLTERAAATFRDGLLEVTMPAPPQHVNRGRRLQISEGRPVSK